MSVDQRRGIRIRVEKKEKRQQQISGSTRPGRSGEKGNRPCFRFYSNRTVQIRVDSLQIDPRMHTRASSDQGPDSNSLSLSQRASGQDAKQTDEGVMLPMQHCRWCGRSPHEPTHDIPREPGSRHLCLSLSIYLSSLSPSARCLSLV